MTRGVIHGVGLGLLLLLLGMGCGEPGGAGAGAASPPPVGKAAVDAGATGACAPMECHGEGWCDAVLAPGSWIWRGAAGCVEFSDSGCSLVGPDCKRMFDDQAACEQAMSGCPRTGGR